MPDKPTQYQNESDVINTLETLKPDLLITASYGELIPWETIQHTQYGGLNVHPSLLPRWRGADPVPWAILAGDHQTGASVVTLEKNFDEGKIIGQKKIPITNNDSHSALRQALFEQGANLLVEVLPSYLDGSNKGIPQNTNDATWARRLTRDDGYIPWEVITKAINGENAATTDLPSFIQNIIQYSALNPQLSTLIERAIRALSPWPGVWSQIRQTSDVGRMTTKRIKILSGHVEHHEGKEKLVIDQVQLEGKTPTPFTQFSAAFPTLL